jgi:hypothetical protein
MMKGYTMRDRYGNSTWLKTQIRVDGHGIHRWRDSNQVPSAGILCRMGLIPEEMERRTSALDADLDAFAAEYVRQCGLRTPEEFADERAEARGVYGPGVEVLNIFSGEHYQTYWRALSADFQGLATTGKRGTVRLHRSKSGIAAMRPEQANLVIP